MTPLYYAEGEDITRFELEGENLDLIPANSVGYISRNNDDPSQLIETTDGFYVGDITELSYERLVVEMRKVTSHGSGFYLGVIANETTKEIYWENNTRPLP